MLKFSLLTIGIAATLIGCYGTFEHAYKLEGTMSYLVLAAPVVAACAALIPFFAEKAWQARHRVKAILWALVLVPAGATVFFAAAERVHYAKAGAAAERVSLRSSVARAEAALADAKAKVVKAEADAKAARRMSRKQCDTACVARWDSEASAARARVTEAMSAVQAAEGRAVAESPMQAPLWLLPLALDLVAFLAIWTGLAITAVAPVKRRRRRKATRRPKPAPALRVVGG